MSDTLQRFLFENNAIRGEIVHLDATYRAVLERRDYPPVLRGLLGELMAAAALLATTIKFEGRLSLQAQGRGPVKLLFAECTSRHTLRALAQWEGGIEAAPLPQLLGDGRMAITIEPEGKERYQGIVALEGATLAQALENYFARSEQLETKLWLTAGADRAAGLLLQQLPRQSHEDADAWDRAVHLSSTLTPSELLGLAAPEVVRRLYHEEDIRLFSRLPVSFRCSCSRERVEGVLRMLGADEVRGILAEQGQIGVNCEFCGGHYALDAVDVAQLFAAPAPETSRTRH
jgi:molecular chaperone Hsp33